MPVLGDIGVIAVINIALYIFLGSEKAEKRRRSFDSRTDRNGGHSGSFPVKKGHQPTVTNGKADDLICFIGDGILTVIGVSGFRLCGQGSTARTDRDAVSECGISKFKFVMRRRSNDAIGTRRTRKAR